MKTPDAPRKRFVRETRWHREYALEEPNHLWIESKFSDASVHITLGELEKEWPNWTAYERIDFCQSVVYGSFEHLPDVLRFVIRSGDLETWAAIALSAVHHLPAEETIPFLLTACRRCEPERASNFLQALAKSGAPEAHLHLQEQFRRLWQNPGLFVREPSLNSIASAAIFCIQHLLDLGEPAADFGEQYRALANHPNEMNRRQAEGFLSKYFPHQR